VRGRRKAKKQADEEKADAAADEKRKANREDPGNLVIGYRLIHAHSRMPSNQRFDP
jgi:hypothetical protein